MRLTEILLNILDTELRRWASVRVSNLLAGRRLCYVKLSNGFCGIAVCEGLEGLPSLSPHEPLTPRLLARRVRNPLSAGLALAALSAVYSIKLYRDGFTPLRSVAEVVTAVSSIKGGMWLRELTASVWQTEEGLTVVGEDIVAESLGNVDFGDVLVGGSPTPGLARRLGFAGYVGTFIRPELCGLVGFYVSIGYGLGDVLERVRGILLYGELWRASKHLS